MVGLIVAALGTFTLVVGGGAFALSQFFHALELVRNSKLSLSGITDRFKIGLVARIEESGKLTDHTKRITNLAKAVYDQRNEDLNLDYLIAGALLHDVGKLLEYDNVDGKYVKGEYGQRFRHPVSGALLAKEFGLNVKYNEEEKKLNIYFID